jgi:hypothetical protein
VGAAAGTTVKCRAERKVEGKILRRGGVVLWCIDRREREETSLAGQEKQQMVARVFSNLEGKGWGRQRYDVFCGIRREETRRRGVTTLRRRKPCTRADESLAQAIFKYRCHRGQAAK